jgi:hypothetical protein
MHFSVTPILSSIYRGVYHLLCLLSDFANEGEAVRVTRSERRER